MSVPYGICVGPTNIKAGGHGCPFRFRCVGCDRLRTDPSYLPEPWTYLDTSLRDRERRATAIGLDAWARTEATPSEEKIKRIRTLITDPPNLELHAQRGPGDRPGQPGPVNPGRPSTGAQWRPAAGLRAGSAANAHAVR